MPVAAKICQVMKEVGYLKKDKRLSGGGSYDYLSEEKMTAELHGAFADAGLVIIPTNMEILNERIDTLKSGSLMYNCRIRASFRFYDNEDGSFIDAQTIGEGSDMGDKCLNKCMTAAYKYVLRQSFMISTGDDPDHTASAEAAQSTRQNTQQAQRPPAAQNAPTGAATGQGTQPEYYRWWKVVNTIPGLTEPNPDREGKMKPSGEWFHLCKKYNLPFGYSKWTAAETDKAITIAQGYQGEGEQPPDIGDPFA